MPPEARPDGTAVACGNRLYVLGGLCAGDPSCPDQIFDSTHYNNCVFYFDCARPSCGWKRAPPMLVPRLSPSAVTIGGMIYVFGSTPLTGGGCFAEVFNIHENRWDILPSPPVSSLDLLCSSDPVLFDHSRSRILVHFITNHSLYAFSPAPDGGSWECLDTEFWSWANASAIVDDVAYFLSDPISDWVSLTALNAFPKGGTPVDFVGKLERRKELEVRRKEKEMERRKKKKQKVRSEEKEIRGRKKEEIEGRRNKTILVWSCIDVKVFTKIWHDVLGSSRQQSSFGEKLVIGTQWILHTIEVYTCSTILSRSLVYCSFGG
ncbi:hypothetical protein V6N11_048434 [Hibiscus sabdariffa]|uniref:Uncharacterized protein n=1 Tax=Hibiscus sabdariffa TaxID=183260 RepID=A0ABR2PV89_9ROSI